MPNRCPFWKDYDSIGGSISYCDLAAFNKPVNPAFLAQIGCTPEKRKECLGTMELNIGTGAVPEPPAPPVVCDPPPIVAKNAVGLAEKKAATNSPALQLLALLAGAYIAMGAVLSTVVTNDLAAYIGDGLSRLVGGATFSLGLVLVIMGGAELFTGNNLMVTGLLDKKVTLKQVLNNWGWVYLFNFIGSILIAILFLYSGIWKANDCSIAIKAINTASAKASLPWGEAFVRGIFCNWLVCMAVWLSLAGKDAISKILGIMLPVTAFVAIGLEHSIANMYFIPMGIFLKNQAVLQPLLASGVSQSLNWSGFILNNLIPVTIGNMVGGILFVAIIYWNAYLRPSIQKLAGTADTK
ncbi:MAG: formate/nitrite transporter family protein [Firmicutes bacterium]|jgi:formate/nitrite transporter|nr:formate/nitrite transporter family protein [Bacillota bacterium]